MTSKTKPDFSHLGLLLAFSAAYIDGVMAYEHPEIRKHWETIREYLLKVDGKKG